MNTELLNRWGEQFLNFAWPMLWQSSVLIAVIFALDLALRRKVRAAVRHALWLVVLVKLVLPPSLALPTGPSWWIHSPAPPPAKGPPVSFTVTYGEQTMPDFQPPPAPTIPPPKQPALTSAAWTIVFCGVVSAGLLAWLLVRWRQIHRKVRRANDSRTLQPVLGEAQRLAYSHPGIRLKLTEDTMSPAVCGLFRPVILLPRSLVEKLSTGQLRAVLLHELIHLRRGDVWVNCAQALLQIVYWWHPLLWLANARIRRVREEAVDDAVMLALRDDAEIYAPTLLEVAKFAFRRPLASLGLVGILESRSALRQRIERLMDFRAPKKAGLTIVSILGILAFSAVALPMGEAPEKTAPVLPSVNGKPVQINSSVATSNDLPSRVTPFKINQPIKKSDLMSALLKAGVKIPPTVLIYMDNGICLARGSEEQLALVEQVVMKLNGYSTGQIETAIKIQNALNRSKKQFGTPAGAKSVLTNLETRVFKVDPNTFTSTLRKLSGLNTTDIATMAQRLFGDLGVDLTTPGKTLAYSLGKGLLFVRATPSELDTVERVVQALNQSAPQIHSKTKFLEVPEAEVEQILKAGTAVDTNTVVIIAADKMRLLLHEWESASGVKDLAEPESVTTAGRQVQMRSDNLTVDLVPNILSDGYTIDLNAIVSKPEKMTTRVNVWDGQTLALILPRADGKNRLVIFITSWVIDPAGNRVHSNDELRQMQEKAKSDMPPQHTSILSDTNFQAKLHALEQRTGVEKLAEPEPIATAGRQVQQMRADYVLQQPQYSSPGREAIYRKLNSIRLESVKWGDGIALSEALRFLAEQSRLHDPDKKGVNFSFNPNARWAAAPDIDPATGMPVASAPASEIVDIKSITVKLTMKDVSLNDLLDAMVLSADHPIKYSVQDYGVVISPHDPAQLEMRVFKVDTNTFLAGITNISTVNGIPFPKISNRETNSIQSIVKEYFAWFGVDLTAPNKSIAFNDRLGLLFVRATPSELDTVERAVQALNQIPPQIHIKARFIAVPKAGFVAQLPTNVVAGQMTGILTDPEFRVVLHALEQRAGVESLAEPECVTTSGRQTQMRSTTIMNSATNFTISETSSTSTSGIPQAKQVEVGPVLDVVPYVLADGYTINLNVTASVIAFLGYDKTTDTNRPLPGFRVQKIKTTANLWDSQTLVLGNLKSDFIGGDGQIQNESKFFQDAERKNGTADKELLIFITATIVDPAGNRAHSDDELPFKPNTIPPQPKLPGTNSIIR